MMNEYKKRKARLLTFIIPHSSFLKYPCRLPATVAPAGTSRVTNEPARRRLSRADLDAAEIVAPVPMDAPRRTTGALERPVSFGLRLPSEGWHAGSGR